MNNQEKIFCSEKYQDSKGYQYLANQLDNFIMAQKSKNKSISKVIFEHLLEIICSIASYRLFYWLLMINVLFYSIIICAYNICSIYQYDFRLTKSNFELISIIFSIPLIISVLMIVLEKRRIDNEYAITIIEIFENYKIINNNSLLDELLNSLTNRVLTLEELLLFELDLKKLVEDRNKSQKIILVIMPLFIIIFFIGIQTIGGLNIGNINQKFTRLSGGFSLIVTVIAILTWIFNIKPRDIILYERFLHILSKVKIKANL